MELEPLALPTPTWEAAVSDQALLVDAKSDDGFDLWAYLFDTAMLIKMPIGPYDFFGANIDGSLAVWCEGDFDENLGEYNNQRIYAFRLPDGPKVEVAAREAMSYPKVKDGWITWVEGAPWEENPDEYWRLRIYGVQVDPNGNPKAHPWNSCRRRPRLCSGTRYGLMIFRRHTWPGSRQLLWMCSTPART